MDFICCLLNDNVYFKNIIFKVLVLFNFQNPKRKSFQLSYDFIKQTNNIQLILIVVNFYINYEIITVNSKEVLKC